MNNNSSDSKNKTDEIIDYYMHSRRKREVLTAKYLEENYALDDIKSDNVLRSTGRYIVKYYKPSRNCNYNFFHILCS